MFTFVRVNQPYIGRYYSAQIFLCSSLGSKTSITKSVLYTLGITTDISNSSLISMLPLILATQRTIAQAHRFKQRTVSEVFRKSDYSKQEK